MSLSHWRCSGTGPAPRSATTAASPFLVEMRILPSRRAFCLREQRLELHSRVRSARLGAGGSRRGLRPTRGAPPGDPRRHRLSESVAKARIEPGRRRIIVGIPRFFSRPIPARSAFATDLDTSPSQTVPGAPPAPLRVSPSAWCHRWRRGAPAQRFRESAGGPPNRLLRPFAFRYAPFSRTAEGEEA